MESEPDVLILDEPTRGIDVGAKYEIYCIMNQLVAEGKSVVMISSEMPEILGMCDRIYVMRTGEVVKCFTREEATQENIVIPGIKRKDALPRNSEGMRHFGSRRTSEGA